MSVGKLPEGWVGTRLAEICSKPQYGYTTKSSISGEIKYLRTTDITNGPLNWDTVPYCLDNPDDVKKYQLHDRDIVISRAGSIGFSSLVCNPPKNTVFASYLIRFTPSNFISEFYLKKYFESGEYWSQLNSMSAGNAVQNVNAQKLSTLLIPIAPVCEQKIIAEKLDNLLSRVESIKNRLENIPALLKKFRQSVLSAAVSGKLTEEWRRGFLCKDSDISANWSRLGLSEVGELSRGKSKHRPRNDPRLFGNEHPFIQTGEVANSFGRIKEATKFYSDFGLSQSRLFPKGTLCITIAANIADTAILDIDACFPDSVVGFIPNENAARSMFVKYLIDVNKQKLETFAPATAQKNINLKVLNELILPFPSIKEQTEIVRRTEQLFAFADSVETQVNNALTRVNNLTQSILAKAFRGELSAQWRADNPDLISGINSAEALLEKISAEKLAELSGTKRGRMRTN